MPHYTGNSSGGKIEQCALPATALRPAYLIQNEIRQKDGLLEHASMAAFGAKDISLVDVRDIGDAAARDLLRRERAG